eukprot:996161_1
MMILCLMKTYFTNHACTGHRNVLIVMKTVFDEIIGGFMSIGMHPKGSSYLSHRYLTDSKAFLFTIKPPFPQIFTLKEEQTESNQNKAIKINKNQIFGFGTNDLFVLNCNAENKKHIRPIMICGAFKANPDECIYTFDPNTFFRETDWVDSTAYCDINMIELYQIHL